MSLAVNYIKSKRSERSVSHSEKWESPKVEA